MAARASRILRERGRANRNVERTILGNMVGVVLPDLVATTRMLAENQRLMYDIQKRQNDYNLRKVIDGNNI